jgi:Domain of unknown function (DUF4189)
LWGHMRKFLTLAFAAQVALCASPSGGHAEGAFAVGESGSGYWVGWSGNKQTKADARSEALRSCLSQGPYCEIKMVITNTCFAFARTVDDSRVFAAVTRPAERQAQTDALSQCFARSGRACRVQSFCDTIDEDARLAVERQREEYQRQQVERQRAASNADALAAEQRRISAAMAAAEAAEQRRTAGEYEAQQAERQRAMANAATQAAEQRRIVAERAAAEAEQRAQAAEQRRIVAEKAAAEAEQRAQAPPPPPGLLLALDRNSNDLGTDFFSKPVSKDTALAILLFCIWMAIKEMVKSKVPPKYKFLAVFIIAGIEWSVYYVTGVNPGEPKIIDLVAMSVPLLGVAIVFGFFIKSIET